MKSYTYTLTFRLSDEIQQVEALRTQLLLYSIPRKKEIGLCWEAFIERIYYSLRLSDIPVTLPLVIAVASFQQRLQSGSLEKLIQNYKKALDYIALNWLVNDTPLGINDVIYIHKLINKSDLHIKESTLKELLDYVQRNNEHPLVRAGLIHIGIVQLQPFKEGNGRLSRLLTTLMLYKAGYDMRNLLCIENSLWHQQEEYVKAIETVNKDNNLSSWLLFFVKSIRLQLEAGFERVASGSISASVRKEVELSDRQMAIYQLFAQPDLRITNKKIQQAFKVSQITASRDLAKLVSLGLIVPHGKGRSIYYTRI